jgi:hypothetical protein
LNPARKKKSTTDKKAVLFSLVAKCSLPHFAGRNAKKSKRAHLYYLPKIPKNLK